jgi:hypothetical protein
MEDRVSREAKLQVVKDIVTTYIKSAVIKRGELEQRLDMTSDDVCALFRQVYEVVDQTVPDNPRRVGLGV